MGGVTMVYDTRISLLYLFVCTIELVPIFSQLLAFTSALARTE